MCGLNRSGREATLFVAKKAIDLGQPGIALQLGKGLVSNNPFDGEALSLLARCAQSENLTQIAEKLARKATIVAPNLMLPYSLHGSFSLSSEMLTAIDSIPDNCPETDSFDYPLAELFCRLAFAANSVESIEEARDLLQRITSQNALNADFWCWLARLELYLGNGQFALGAAIKGRLLNPEKIDNIKIINNVASGDRTNKTTFSDTTPLLRDSATISPEVPVPVLPRLPSAPGPLCEAL